MIKRYRKEENGEMVEDENGAWMEYRDYLADEGNWVPLENYDALNTQFRELLASLREKKA